MAPFSQAMNIANALIINNQFFSLMGVGIKHASCSLASNTMVV
jgi:hypothetical protein